MGSDGSDPGDSSEDEAEEGHVMDEGTRALIQPLVARDKQHSTLYERPYVDVAPTTSRARKERTNRG